MDSKSEIEARVFVCKSEWIFERWFEQPFPIDRINVGVIIVSDSRSTILNFCFVPTEPKRKLFD